VREGFPLRICGRVTSGLGKGRVFLSLEPYRKALEKLIGEEVYPGTLNIRVALEEWRKLYESATFFIPSFVWEGRRYGTVKAVPVELNGSIPGAVLFPEKGIRPALLEIVSPYSLRERFSLRDGDPFCFRVKETKDPQEK